MNLGRVCVLSLGLVLLSSCGGEGIVPPASDAPFVYLVLNDRSESLFDGAVRQHALLLTTGSPVDAEMRYRWADRFVVERASDGATYPFEPYDKPLERAIPEIRDGNYFLAGADSSPSGDDALVPGERYRLRVDTEGVAIRGRATIPDAIDLRVVRREGRRVVVWSRVDGAAGYAVSVYPNPTTVQADTAFVVPGDRPDGSVVRVRALDENLYRYMTDDRVGRAGIDRGFGVFGGVTTDTLTL